MVLWLSLPRSHSSGVKELIMAKVGSEELKKETGVEKFVEAMNEAFGATKESRELEIYEEYYTKMKRKQEEKMTDFINRFDKAASLAKRHKMDLPAKVKGLKLLRDAGLTEQDRKLVLTEENFDQEEDVYRQARVGIYKYLADGGSQSTVSIKLREPTKEEEEVLETKGWTRPGARDIGARGGYKRGGKRRGRGRRQSGEHRAGGDVKIAGSKKKKNSAHCPSCNSVRHLLADCPDSYENLRKKKKKAEQEKGDENETMAEGVFMCETMAEGVFRCETMAEETFVCETMVEERFASETTAEEVLGQEKDNENETTAEGVFVCETMVEERFACETTAEEVLGHYF